MRFTVVYRRRSDAEWRISPLFYSEADARAYVAIHKARWLRWQVSVTIERLPHVWREKTFDGKAVVA